MDIHKNKLSIFIVTCEFDQKSTGGIGRYVTELVKYLKIKNINVTICLLGNSNESDVVHYISNESDVILVPKINNENIHYIIENILKFINIKKIKIDLIHINDFQNHLFILNFMKRIDLPVIYTMHALNIMTQFLSPQFLYDALTTKKLDNKTIEKYEFEKEILEISNILIFPSKSAHEWTCKFYNNIKFNERCYIISHGVIDDYMKLSKKDVFDIKQEMFKDDPKIIIYAGRLNHQKGLKYLIEAFEIVKNKYTNCKLIIAGDGNVNYFKNFAVKLKISNDVLFTGYIEKNKLFILYQISDIGVFPSLWETFGYSAIEMMHTGLPTIVSEIECYKENLHSYFSIKIKEDLSQRYIDKNELSQKILFLLNNKKYCDNSSVYLKKYIKKRFNAVDNFEKIIDVYKMIIK